MTGIFTVAKGRILQLGKDVQDAVPGTSLKVLLLQSVSEADAVLAAHTTVASILTTNTEATFDNYARKTLANVAYGTAAAEAFLDADDFSWVLAGSSGAGTNNTVDKAILYFDDGSNTIPLCFYRYEATTSGIDLLFTIPASGLYRI